MTDSYIEGGPDDLEEDQEVVGKENESGFLSPEKDKATKPEGRDRYIIEEVVDAAGVKRTVFRQVIPKESKINDLNELGTPRTTGPGGWPKR